MPDQRSLKEKLLDVLEEIDIIILDIADRIVVGRRPDAESQESITSLADSFQEQYIQFVQLVQSVPDHQERERKIRELETYAENRDKMLFNIAEQLIRTQDILDKNTMQAEQKLRSVHESENKRVFSEDVVRLANQISKGHSVTCSPDWQQGEPSRPFPTAADFAVSHLMRASLGANRTAQAPSTSATVLHF